MIIPIKRLTPRAQAILIPTLQESLEVEYPGIKVGSWVEQVLDRQFPLVNLRRVAGSNASKDPNRLDESVIEYTAYGDVSYPNTEQLCMDTRQIIYEMWAKQVVVPNVGYIHSFFQTLSPTQFDSPFDDTWRVQGMIQLGLRPTRDKE